MFYIQVHCSFCNGQGYFQEWDQEFGVYRVPCPVCGGDGLVLEETQYVWYETVLWKIIEVNGDYFYLQNDKNPEEYAEDHYQFMEPA